MQSPSERGFVPYAQQFHSMLLFFQLIPELFSPLLSNCLPLLLWNLLGSHPNIWKLEFLVLTVKTQYFLYPPDPGYQVAYLPPTDPAYYTVAGELRMECLVLLR